jgi:hypothetical protein
MFDATESKLTPYEKIKNSNRIKFSQFSSKPCDEINVQREKKTLLK